MSVWVRLIIKLEYVGIAWSGNSSDPQQIDNKNQKVVWQGYETFNDAILQCQLMAHCQILITEY